MLPLTTAAVRDRTEMIINTQGMDLLYQGFKSTFRDSYDKTPSDYGKIAMTIPSQTRDETYGWIRHWPNMREWVGPRVVQNLGAASFKIRNLDFELTVGVPRNDIADDQYGVYGPMMAQLGAAAKQHPDEVIFGLLATAFAAECYDGQPFFDADHPVVDAAGATVSVSNTGGGSGTPWMLFDTSRAVRPIIWQERETYAFVKKDQPGDDNVFFEKEFIYGVNARVNAGFGLWQLAYGSKQTLDAAAYAVARGAMMAFKRDGGKPMGVKPNVLVVPPSLEEAGLKLLNSEFGSGGESNPWKGTAELIVTPWLA